MRASAWPKTKSADGTGGTTPPDSVKPVTPQLTVASNIAEVFLTGGLTVGAALLIAALIVRLLDGTWIKTRAAVEQDEHGPLVRWFGDDGEVYEHGLTSTQFRALEGNGWVDIYVRRGAAHRMRLEPLSSPVRLLRLLGFIILGVGILALAVSWGVMFAAA